MIASKHFDPVMGVDIHIVLIPTPAGPVPTPLPHPFIGMVIDPMDYAPFIGATVMVNSIPRGVAGSAGKNIPSHIPMGGPFQKPPGNECENFMGSSTVLADGEPLSFLGLPVLSCHDIGMPPPPRPKKKGTKTKSMVLPTSVLLSVPAGPLVLVGGAPTVSMMALGMRAGMAALGGAFKKLKKGKGKGKKGRGRKGKKGNKAASNEGSCKGGCPVDAITGSVVEEFTDFELSGPFPFRWRRYYDSSWAREPSPVGLGWRHEYQATLQKVADGFILRTGHGSTVELPPIDADSGTSVWSGYELSPSGHQTYHVRRTGHPTLEFTFRGGVGLASVSRLLHGQHSAVFEYDASRKLAAIQLSTGSRIRILNDGAGRIAEVAVVSGERTQTVARYGYDAEGSQVSFSDAEGHQTTYGYDAPGRLVRMTNPLSYSIYYTYDGEGRCSRTWGEDGLYDESFEYFPEIKESVRKSASGATWTYVYDDLGTLVQIIDPYGGNRTFKLDEAGRVVEDVDPNGLSTQLLYDPLGDHTGRLTPLGVVNPPAHVDNDPPDPLPLRLPRTPAGWSWGGILRPSRIRWGGNGKGPEGAPGGGEFPSGSAAPGGRRRDIMGRILEETDASGRTRRWDYDAGGNPTRHTDADGSVTTREYFSWNLLRRETSPVGSAVEYDYNEHEEITRVVDAGKTVSEFAYDLKDQLVEVRRHGRVREQYAYDAAGNLIEKRNGSGEPLLRFEIGPLGLPAKRILASGETHELEYDHLGHFTRVASETGETLFERDGADRAKADLRDGKGVRHTLAWGRVSETTVFDRFRTEFDFDFSGQTVITDPTGSVHDLRVDGRRGMVTRTLANGTVETLRYDRAGQLRERALGRPHAGTTRWSWRYSREGDLLEGTDTRGTTRYEYDAAHRLTAETGPDGRRHRYEYDPAGNLLKKPGVGEIRVGSGNRIASAGAQSFEYDDRDHIACRAEGSRETRYRYDSRDMLVAALVDGEEWTAEYDPLGRRIRKSWGGRTTEYHWDDKRLAAETGPDGSLRIYVYPDMEALVPFMFLDYDSPEAEPEEGKAYFLFTDQRGCPVRVENGDGRAVWQAEVDPYGFARVDPSSSIELNLRMPGHYLDAETGLHYNRFRYYDPRLGRYLQSDPLGLAGGVNLYAYPTNPLNRVDIVGWEHANDVGGAKGKSNKAGGADAESPKAKFGDAEAAEAVAAKGGMDSGHLKNLQQHCKDNNRVVVMRAGNEASVPHIRDPGGTPKPKECKLNTAKSGDNAGKVTTGQSLTDEGASKWKPKEEGGKGYKENYDDLKDKGWTTDNGVVKDADGNYVHGDYDMQGVYDKNPDNSVSSPKKADGTEYPGGTNDPEFQKDMNDALNDPANYDGPDKDMVQHGANDDFKNPDGSPGRTPEPDENYVVVDENGDAQIIEGTDNLQQYYDDNNIEPWPY